MDTDLLITKLYVPPPCQNLVLRPRLTTALSNAMTSSLVLVSAPAGYGKTTLVSNWLRISGVPSAWLSLDEADNDPIRFLQYLITALQKIVPDLSLDLLGMVQEKPPLQFDVLYNMVINEIARRAAPFLLILDDFHLIHAQPVLEMIVYLLDHMPSSMHMVLLSRTDPPLPIFRMRARSQLVEIRAEQLRFTYEETAVFLNEFMELRLSAGDVAALEARTEGWIAGLQLASIAMQAHFSTQSHTDVHRFVTEFTGSHHYIIDYLTEEVLKVQPDKVRSFLLQTSILNSMCASLCEAVVDHDEMNVGEGQAMLEALERMNLFVIPMDEKRQWYRYHHLFAEMLNLRLQNLSSQLLSGLHRRASDWFEQNQIIPDAIQHALMAGDQARAAQLVEQHGCSLLMSGEGFTLLKWVEAVETYAQWHPWLAVLKAWAFALTGRLDRVESTLQMAEGLISSPEASLEFKIMLGSIAAVRAYLANQQGDAQLAANFAQSALEYLPDGNEFSCSIRSVAVSILGDASLLTGNLRDARQAYLEATQISQAAGNIYMSMIANTNLAVVLAEQGHLRQAARVYTETLKLATRPDGQRLPLADRIYAGLAEISYEWNDLEVAERYTHLCIELCRQWGNSDILAKAYLQLAWLERVKGDLENALEALRAAEQISAEGRLSLRQSVYVSIACACWRLAQGNLEGAIQFVQQSGVTSESLTNDPQILDRQGHAYILLLRLLLAQGDHEGALSLAGRLLHLAEAAHRTRTVIEILVLQALVLQAKKDLPQAIQVLERAVTLARPEGFVRVFLDEGEPMAKLLYQAKNHRVGDQFISELLTATGKGAVKAPPLAQVLIEPLTLRELEVLRLIESGCANQEIADRLVISIPTVKRHISNIYAKLGAKSRTHAISLGRELNLLQ